MSSKDKDLRNVEVKSADGRKTTTIGNLSASTVEFGNAQVKVDGKPVK